MEVTFMKEKVHQKWGHKANLPLLMWKGGENLKWNLLHKILKKDYNII